jgi:hypothetical protein
VRAGERYELWVDNWSLRSSAFVIRHFITAAASASSSAVSEASIAPRPSIRKSRIAPR